jgi:predicted RNA binding protein YcfA (HicA-like mRNA interferase family)
MAEISLGRLIVLITHREALMIFKSATGVGFVFVRQRGSHVRLQSRQPMVL